MAAAGLVDVHRRSPEDLGRQVRQEGHPAALRRRGARGRQLIRRWLLRLLAIAALGGVAYGVVEIVSSGTDGSNAPKAPLKPQLRTLADAQEQLAVRLENLKAGRNAPRLLPAIRRARRAQQTAVAALRERQVKRLSIPHESQLQDALDAEFDYLDAVGAVARSRHSPLIKKVADRAQAAKDAFTTLPDSQGVEDGIRSTQAFLTWADAR